MRAAPLLEWVRPSNPYPEGVPPQVCALFEKIAIELHDRGFKRFSADAILHRIRWEMQIDRGERGFLVNNNWSAPLARWFIARNPAAKTFFELRERISA